MVEDGSNSSHVSQLLESTKRDLEAKMLSLQSFLRKGVSLGYVGEITT